MICRVLEYGKSDFSLAWLKARNTPDPNIGAQVLSIIDNVSQNGDSALLEYTRQYDCPDFTPPFRVNEKAFSISKSLISLADWEILEQAVSNIKEFHSAQIEKSWFMTRPDGSILGQRVLPVESVGLYVPGGRFGNTPLVSSLLMNAVPAIVAGCPRIVIVSPPRQDGTLNPHLLAAAAILGLTEIYAIGGPWSIAALALGTESINKVDVIAGPGNIYVTTAKRLLHGTVGIDMIAGPSEVVTLCDSTANPAWIAADMLSQAEHDQLASAICVTDDRIMAHNVLEELEKQLSTLPRKEIASRSLKDWGAVIITSSLQEGIEICNQLAPEHLEVAAKDPWNLLPYLKNAGAIFLGDYSPEPVGDYFAGPNHVLPTMGTARFASPLGVQTFCKKTNIIHASENFLPANAAAIACLARMEALEAHARSVEARTHES